MTIRIHVHDIGKSGRRARDGSRFKDDYLWDLGTMLASGYLIGTAAAWTWTKLEDTVRWLRNYRSKTSEEELKRQEVLDRLEELKARREDKERADKLKGTRDAPSERGLGRGLVSLNHEQNYERRVHGGSSSLVNLPRTEWRELPSTPEFTPPPRKSNWKVEMRHKSSGDPWSFQARAETKEEAERQAMERAPDYRVSLTRRTGDFQTERGYVARLRGPGVYAASPLFITRPAAESWMQQELAKLKAVGKQVMGSVGLESADPVWLTDGARGRIGDNEAEEKFLQLEQRLRRYYLQGGQEQEIARIKKEMEALPVRQEFRGRNQDARRGSRDRSWLDRRIKKGRDANEAERMAKVSSYQASRAEDELLDKINTVRRRQGQPEIRKGQLSRRELEDLYNQLRH